MVPIFSPFSRLLLITISNRYESQRIVSIVRLPVFIIPACHWQYFARPLRKSATKRKDQNGKERSTVFASFISVQFFLFFLFQRRASPRSFNISNARHFNEIFVYTYSIIRYNRITTNVHYDIHCIENVSHIHIIFN